MATVDIADEDAVTGSSSSAWTTGLSMDTSTRYVCRHMMHSDVQQVRELHDQLFPVKYSAGFYSKLVNNPDGNITSLVLVDIEACAKTVNVACEAEKKGSEEREDGCEDSVPTPAIIGVATCRVTDVEDSIVGYLLGHKAAYLMTFGISSEYRRRGLAGLLLERLKEVITARYPTAKEMGLHVQASNEAAFSFYKRAGFRVQSFERDYYTFSEKTPVLPGQSKCNDAYAMSCKMWRYSEGSEQQQMWWKSCCCCCCCDWSCVYGLGNKALQNLRRVISLGGQDKRME